MTTILSLLTFAAVLVVTDHTVEELTVPVSPTTLACSPAKPIGTYPVPGDLRLQLPGIGALTALTHFPDVGINALGETCAGVPALLEEARKAGGSLKARARVLLTRRKEIDASGHCSVNVDEVVTLTLLAREPFRELTSLRTLDVGICD